MREGQVRKPHGYDHLAHLKGAKRQGAALKTQEWHPKGGEAPSTVGGGHQCHTYGPPAATRNRWVPEGCGLA